MLPAFAYPDLFVSGARIRAGKDGYRDRITEDLQRSIALMTRELGRAPRAIAWPYGRYTRLSTEAAAAVGFRFGLTFDPEPADEPPDDDSALFALQRLIAADHRR